MIPLNTIQCRDCLEGMREIPDKSIDLVITDPPYGIKRDKGFEGFEGFGTPIARKQYDGEWDSERPSKEYFDEIQRISNNAIIFGGNFFTDILPQGNHWVVWDKQNTMPTFGDCELAWTSFNKPARIYPWMWNGLIRKGDRKTEGAARYHPTQKPVGLFAAILTDYSKDDQIILDPFLGSGTTMIACENLGRKCRGCEIDPGYIAVILQRYKDTFPDKEITLCKL